MSGLTKDRVTANCADCLYFSWRDHVPQEDLRMWGQNLDGWFRKVFPRGYVGAGKPGGKVYHGKNACFQYEPREEPDQLCMEGVRDGPEE